MAIDFRIEGEARLDTSRAERDLSKFARKAERTKIKLGGIDSKKFTQPLGKITGAVAEFQKSLDASNARVLAFTASAGILYGVVNAFKEMAKATIEVEKTLAGINVILNASSSNLKKFGDGLFQVAKGTGQSFQQVGEAAQEFARQGLGMEKTLGRTRDALILMRLSGMDATAAVNSLTAAINSFNRTAITSTEIINKMANVDAAFAVSTNDLADAIRRVASTAESANVSFDELIAVVTSAQQTTARGGNIIGNSLKTIFTRVQRTGVQQQLEALGVQTKKLNGELRPAMAIMKDFAVAYTKLTAAERAQTAELVGGVYQMNILKAILGDLKKGVSIYDQALRTSLNTTDEAIKRNEELNKTLAALANESMQNLTKLGAEIGGMTFEPAFRTLLEGFNKLTEKTSFFGNISSFFGIDEKDANDFGGKMAKGIMSSVGNFLSGPGLIALTAIAGKLFYGFISFLAKSTKDMMGLNKAAQQQAAVQQTIHSILQSNPALIKQIETGEMSVLKAERLILDALKTEITMRERVLQLSKQMAPAVVGGGVGARIDKSSGTTTLVKKSAGHVPSFSGNMREYVGALQAGYKPGRIKRMHMPGEGTVTYNDAEKVKRFPGIKQPAIIPPGSAGKRYKKAFKSSWGFSPDMSGPSAAGFLPNFLNVLTSMRLGAHMRQGKQGSSGKLKITGAELVKNLGPEMGGIVGYAIPGSEMVTIHTMGQVSPLSRGEKAGFATTRSEGGSRGRAAAKRGGQAEAKFAGRAGMFGLGRFRGRAMAAQKMDPSKLKLPYDAGQRAGGRNFPMESKPSFRKRYVADIFKKTLYENNSSSLRHIKRRLQSKAKAGDMVAAQHLETLQKRIGTETINRGREISQWTMGGGGTPGMSSLSQMNSTMGFDTRNAMAARKEGLFKYAGFIPNFGVAHPRKTGGVWDASASAAMLVPEMGIGDKTGSPAIATVPGTGRGKRATRIKFNIYDPDIPKSRKDSLHKKVEKAMIKAAVQYAREFSPEPIKGMPNPQPEKYFNTGALKASIGNVFEAGLDAAFARTKDIETARFDVRSGTKGAGKVRNLFGMNFTGHADYKASSSSKNQKSMAEKIANEFRRIKQEVSGTKRAAKGGAVAKGALNKGLHTSGGFIPNFGVMDAMDTEEALGGKPVLDYNKRVGLYVRDAKTQSSFHGVLRDHPEGLGRAMKNSKTAQKVLSSSGFVPNFAEEEGGMTGVETGINTMGLAFMAMGMKDLADKFKEVGASAVELEGRFKALDDEGTELKTREDALGDSVVEAERALDSFAEGLKTSDKDKSKLAKADKLEKERGPADLSRRERQEARRRAGVAGKKTSLMTDEEKKKLKDEEKNILKKSNGYRKKEAQEIREGVKARKKNKTSRSKEGRALDKGVIERKKLEQDIKEERTAHDRNKKALDKEAAAHNRNAMSAGQLVGGAKMSAGQGMKMAGQWGQQGAMGAMMAMPMIGGAFRAGGMDDKKAGIVESNFGIAAMGMMTGNPYIMAAAGTIALVKGVKEWGVATRDETAAMSKGVEKAKEKLQEFSDASANYLKSHEEYTNALSDPDISPEQLKKRTDAMFEAVRKIPESFKDDVAAAAASGQGIKETFQEIEKSLKNVVHDMETSKGLAIYAHSLDKKWFDHGGSRAQSWFSGGTFGAGDDADSVKWQTTSKDNRDKVADAVMNRLGKEDVQGRKGDDIIARILDAGRGWGQNQGQRVNKQTSWFREIGLDPTLIHAINVGTRQSFVDMKALHNHLIARIQREQAAADHLDELAEIIAKRKKEVDRFHDNMKKASIALDNFHRNLKSITDIAMLQLSGITERQMMSSGFARTSVLDNQGGLNKLVQPFQRKQSQLQEKNYLARARMESKHIGNVQKLVLSTHRKIVSTFEKKLNENSKTVERLQLKKYKEKKPLSITEKTELSRREVAQKSFSDLLGRVIHQIGNNPDRMIPGVVQNIGSEMSRAGLTGAETDVVVNELKLINEGTQQKLNKMIMQYSQNLMLNELQEKNQRKLIQLQEQLKFGGGVSAFLGGEAPWKKARGFREDRATAEMYGDRERVGKADFKILKELVDKFGFQFTAGAHVERSKIFDDMISSSIQGVAASMMATLNELQKPTSAWSRQAGAGGREEAFKGKKDLVIDAAMNQVFSALKMEEMAPNIAEMRANQQLANEMFAEQWAPLEEANYSAFSRALDDTGVSGMGEVMSSVFTSGYNALNDSLGNLINSFNVGLKIQSYMSNLQKNQENYDKAQILLHEKTQTEIQKEIEVTSLDRALKDMADANFRLAQRMLEMGAAGADKQNFLNLNAPGADWDDPSELTTRAANTDAMAFVSEYMSSIFSPSLSHEARKDVLQNLEMGLFPKLDLDFAGITKRLGSGWRDDITKNLQHLYRKDIEYKNIGYGGSPGFDETHPYAQGLTEGQYMPNVPVWKEKGSFRAVLNQLTETVPRGGVAPWMRGGQRQSYPPVVPEDLYIPDVRNRGKPLADQIGQKGYVTIPYEKGDVVSALAGLTKVLGDTNSVQGLTGRSADEITEARAWLNIMNQRILPGPPGQGRLEKNWPGWEDRAGGWTDEQLPTIQMGTIASGQHALGYKAHGEKRDQYLAQIAKVKKITESAEVARLARISEAHRQLEEVKYLQLEALQDYKDRGGLQPHETKETDERLKKLKKEAQEHGDLSGKYNAMAAKYVARAYSPDIMKQYYSDAIDWEKRRLSLLKEGVRIAEELANVSGGQPVLGPAGDSATGQRHVAPGQYGWRGAQHGPVGKSSRFFEDETPGRRGYLLAQRQIAITEQSTWMREERIKASVDKKEERTKFVAGEAGMLRNPAERNVRAAEWFLRKQADSDLPGVGAEGSGGGPLTQQWIKTLMPGLLEQFEKGFHPLLDVAGNWLREDSPDGSGGTMGDAAKWAPPGTWMEFVNEFLENEKKRGAQIEAFEVAQNASVNASGHTGRGYQRFADYGSDFYWNKKAEEVAKLETIFPDWGKLAKHTEYMARNYKKIKDPLKPTAPDVDLKGLIRSYGDEMSPVERSWRDRYQELDDARVDGAEIEVGDVKLWAKLGGVLAALDKLKVDEAVLIRLAKEKKKLAEAIFNVENGTVERQTKALQILRQIDRQQFTEGIKDTAIAFKRAKFTGIASRTQLGKMKDEGLTKGFAIALSDWGRDQDFDKILSGEFALTDFQTDLVNKLEVLFDEDHENFFRKLQGTLDDNVQKLMRLERLPATRDNRTQIEQANKARHKTRMEQIQFGGYTPDVKEQAQRFGITRSDIQHLDTSEPDAGYFNFSKAPKNSGITEKQWINMSIDEKKKVWEGHGPDVAKKWKDRRESVTGKFQSAGLDMRDRHDLEQTPEYKPGMGRLFEQPGQGTNWWDMIPGMRATGREGMAGQIDLKSRTGGSPFDQEMVKYRDDQMSALNNTIENLQLDLINGLVDAMMSNQDKINILAALNEQRIKKYEVQFGNIYDKEIELEKAKTEKRHILFEMQMKNADQAAEDVRQIERRIMEAGLTPSADKSEQVEDLGERGRLKIRAWRKQYESREFQGGDPTAFNFWGGARKDPAAGKAAVLTSPRVERIRKHNEFMRAGIGKGMRAAQQIIANPQGQYSGKEVEAARVKYENLESQLKNYSSTTAEQIINERTEQIKESFIEIDKILKEFIEDRKNILQKNIEILEDSVKLEGLDPTMYGIERMGSKQKLFDDKLRQILAPNEEISSRLLLQNMRDLMENATGEQTEILKDLEKLLSEGFELQLQRLDAEIKELDRTILGLRNAPSTSQNLESLSTAIEQRMEKNLDQFMFGTSGRTRETNMIDAIKRSLGLQVSGTGGSGGNQPLGLFAGQTARIRAGLEPKEDWRRLGIGRRGTTYEAPDGTPKLPTKGMQEIRTGQKWMALHLTAVKRASLQETQTKRQIQLKELQKKAIIKRGGEVPKELTIALIDLKKTLNVWRQKREKSTSAYEEKKAHVADLLAKDEQVDLGSGKRVPKFKGKMGEMLFSLNEKMFGKKGEKPKWQQEVEKEVGFEFAMRKGYQPFGGFNKDVFGAGAGVADENVWKVERQKLEEQAKLMNLSVGEKKKWVNAMLAQQRKFEDEMIRLSKESADLQFEAERRKLFRMKMTGQMPQAINAQAEVTWQAGRRAWNTATGGGPRGIPGAQGMNIFSGPSGGFDKMKGHIDTQIKVKQSEAEKLWKKQQEFGDSPEGRATQARAEAADKEVKRLELMKKTFEGLAKDGQTLAEAWGKIKTKSLKDDITALDEKIKLDELDPGTLNRETMEDRRELTRKKVKDHEYSINDSFDNIFANWKYGMEEMTIDADEALYQLSGQFRSGIATAFGEAIKGTKTLREAFEDMFMKLADYALDEFLKATVNRMFGAMAGSAGGGAEGGMVRHGGIQKFAGGGMVTGGTGSRDDVPAFLANGEYVLRKAAVKKYGVSLLDLINNEGFGKIQKYATGGSVVAGHGPGRILGDPQLGEPMYVLYPDGSRTLVSEMGALRRQRGLPTYTHTDPDPGIFGKANYDVDYWTHLAESTERGGRGMSVEDIAKIKKQWEDNAFADPQEGLTSRIQHGSRGRWIDYNLRNAFIYDSDKFPTLDHSYFSIDKRLTRQALTDDNNPRNKIREEKRGKLYKYYEDRASDLIGHAEAVTKWKAQRKKRMKYTLYAAIAGMGLNALTSGGIGVSTPGSAGTAGGNIWSWLTGASGGLVSGEKQLKKASGGLIGDSVPAMLMGGEYVINRNAVQKYGSDFFTQLNKQTVPGFAEGGYVGGTGIRENKNGNTKDFTSVSEGQGDTTNNIEINVNVSSDGRVSTDPVSAEGMSPERARALGNMIRQQVVDTIIQQKRQGGILHASMQQ